MSGIELLRAVTMEGLIEQYTTPCWRYSIRPHSSGVAGVAWVAELYYGDKLDWWSPGHLSRGAALSAVEFALAKKNLHTKKVYPRWMS